MNTVISGARLFTKNGDFVSTNTCLCDEFFAEFVANHAVADDNNFLFSHF